jgi:short-subunit dehydrogenase
MASELAAQGYMVAVVARREEKLAHLCDAILADASDDAWARAYVHDVTDFETVPGLFQTIVRDLGGLDLIVYVAGAQPMVALDEYSSEKDALMVETNLLGAIAWLNLAAIRFQRAGAGHIVGISSIAGDRGRVASPVYGASKAGLDTYLEALRNRLSRHGVAVTTIKPGFVDTVLLKNAPRTFWVISPAVASRQILRAIRKKKQLAYIPARWRLVSLIVRNVPSFLFRKLNV